MKIAFLVPSLEQCGPIIYTRNLIDGLSADPTLEVEVFYLWDRPGKMLEFKVPTHLLRLQAARKLLGFDIIHSTQFFPDLILALLPVARKRKISGLHNLLDQDLGFLYNRMSVQAISTLWYWALKRIGNFVYSTQYMAQYYRDRLHPRREVVIDYGIPVPFTGEVDPGDRALFKSLQDSGLRIVGTVCMLIKRKGVDQLVHALVHLPDCAVVVVGDGPETGPLNQLATELGVKERFHILGFREQSSRYYAKFDMFALVSWSEGFGLAMLEALGTGLPVVCSRLPFYTESLRDTDLAFFEVGNHQDLLRAIRSVLATPEAWSAASLRVFDERFTLAAMAMRHITYYNSNFKPT
jgi:glycosyltransferase involved in cell wall biosynthesis